jgi:hypothetical protein
MIRKYMPHIFAVVLIATAVLVMLNRRGGTLRQDISDFLPAPEAAIDRFSISRTGEKIDLRDTPGGWMVNGESRAKPDVVTFFFETLRRLEVAPVSRRDLDRLRNSLPVSGREVVFYEDGRKKASFFIGFDSTGVRGTYIMKRNGPPYRVTVKGYDQPNIEGFFSTRSENWQLQKLLGYQAASLSSVSVAYPQHPEQNFTLNQGPPGVYAVSGRQAANGATDLEKAGDYLNFFGEISYSRVKKPSAYMRAGQPDATLSIQPLQGNRITLDIYPFYTEGAAGATDKNLAVTVVREHTDTVIVKYSDLDPLLLTFSDFQKK